LKTVPSGSSFSVNYGVDNNSGPPPPPGTNVDMGSGSGTLSK
jgi:hypothetical protein